MAECADGYGIIHYEAAAGKRGVSTRESFQLDSGKCNMSVRDLAQRNLPEHDEFFVWDAPVVKDNKTGEYVRTVGGKERIDFVSLGQLRHLTADRARADAQAELRDFFNQPDSPFFE